MKALFLGLSTVCWVGICLSAEPVYFIVGGPIGAPTNSFLLPLTNAADITKARKIVAASYAFDTAFPGLEDPKPVVSVRLGSDGINRDALAPGQPLWSWHVGTFLQWVAGGLDNPYQYPWQVERDVVAGTFQDGSAVLFSDYNLLAELNPRFALYVLEYPGLPGGTPHIFYWTYSASNMVFNVEWTPTLSPPAWKALTPQTFGVSKPAPNVLDVGGYVVPNGGFFRLRADPKPSP